MSGGYFDYHQYNIRNIADIIEEDIKRALQPKPEKVHEDYWIIYKRNPSGSYRSYVGYQEFKTYEEAESFLLIDKSIVKSKRKIDPEDSSLKNSIIFESKKDPNELYVIHHAVFDHYPYELEVLDLSDETIELMKQAYKQLRIAEIYAQRVDWMMSGDDDENDFKERLQKELESFKEEFSNKDWSQLTDE